MFRTIKSVVFSLLVLMAFNSCEKEMSQENGGISTSGTQSGTAIYTLDGAPNGCITPLINGDYVVGTPMDLTNSVIVTVNVASVGTYVISTALINGIKFTGSGTFAATGPQSITLLATGTPTAAMTATYVPGTSGCSFLITATTVVVGPVAVFTLDGAPNACTSPTINGNYGAGAPLDGSNTVQLSVTVTTAGTYNITTPTVNGFSFTGSGTLAAGPQTITLHGTGTPGTSGAAVFTPVTGGCQFTINVTTAGGTSIYTLNGAPAACTSPTIAGSYTAGFPLGASNTITVTANVTQAGTYSISTGAVNGMTFSASGSLTVGTSQTIVLTGSGTPTAANTSNFTIGVNGCTFPITTVAPPPAAFTLTGAPGVCSPISVDGNYNTGIALNSSNTVSVQANVTTAGAYTITSTTANGMTFSKTGVFAGTGNQTVILAGSGTPAAAGTNTFTVGTGGCTFDITVVAPTSPCSGLTDGIFTMTGQFTLNGFSFGTSFGSQFQVTIQEISSGLQVDVFFPGTNPPAPGTYSIGIVTIHCLYISGVNGMDWNATSGSVYVGTDISGATVVEFCNVNFFGTPLTGGSSATSTGAGKMVF